MTSTTSDTADLDASDVAWDLEPLVDGKGAAGVDEAMDAADALAASIETRRGRIADIDVDGLVAVMQEMAELAELIGKAGSYAGLRFAVDTMDPELGALMQRVEERGTAINTRVLFFELEWAALSDERVDELLADDRLEFVRHYLRSARRYRPHLLTEPEEKILAE
jgi:oligoendopeptidase F